MTWPETEIGQVASVPCPCGVSDPLIQELRGTRRCGGAYDTGAMWEEPQCDSCQFSNTRLTLCQLAEVSWLWRRRSTVVLGNANCQHAHCIHPLLHVLPFQIDSPALLANMLVNATNNTEEIESADVSLIVGLLSNVTNSSEDLQQEGVSGHSDCHCLSLYFHSQYHYTYCRCKRTFCQLWVISSKWVQKNWPSVKRGWGHLPGLSSCLYSLLNQYRLSVFNFYFFW